MQATSTATRYAIEQVSERGKVATGEGVSKRRGPGETGREEAGREETGRVARKRKRQVKRLSPQLGEISTDVCIFNLIFRVVALSSQYKRRFCVLLPSNFLFEHCGCYIGLFLIHLSPKVRRVRVYNIIYVDKFANLHHFLRINISFLVCYRCCRRSTSSTMSMVYFHTKIYFAHCTNTHAPHGKIGQTDIGLNRIALIESSQPFLFSFFFYSQHTFLTIAF